PHGARCRTRRHLAARAESRPASNRVGRGGRCGVVACHCTTAARAALRRRTRRSDDTIDGRRVVTRGGGACDADTGASGDARHAVERSRRGVDAERIFGGLPAAAEKNRGKARRSRRRAERSASAAFSVQTHAVSYALAIFLGSTLLFLL